MGLEERRLMEVEEGVKWITAGKWEGHFWMKLESEVRSFTPRV